MTAFLIDVAVFGIIAFCAWRGYKNGLIRGVFGVVSLIISLMVANVAAQAYSKDAIHVIMPFASGMIESATTEIEEEGITYQPLAHDHDVDDPEFREAYTVLRQLGLPEAASVVLAKQMIPADSEDAGDSNSFIDLLAEKLTYSFSYVAVFGIAFLILAIVFAVIGNLVGFIFSLPGLKLVDVISGAAFGLVKGLIIAFTVAFIIRYFGILSPSILERTNLLNALVSGNPIANIFGY